MVAWNTPQSFSLQARPDLANVWDIRVAPSHQRQGVGKALFSHTARWARARKCRWLNVETQNINVRACKFYAAQGCTLRAVQLDAYEGWPGEHEFLWVLDL